MNAFEKKRLQLCIVINPSFALTSCYAGQYEDLQTRGYDITAVAGVGEEEHRKARALGVTTYVIPMSRYVNFISDLRSLVRIWLFFRSHHFDIVQVSTPKASFLGILAGRLAGQRRIMYLVRGRAYECRKGPLRWFYGRLDALCCHLSDVVVPVSASLAEVLRVERICPADKIRMVNRGSSSGIDVAAYEPTDDRLQAADQLRRSYGIKSEGLVVLFVGWVRREKGVVELIDAMQEVRATHPDVHLIVLGDEHEPADVPLSTRKLLENEPGNHWHRRTGYTVPFYHAADIVVLPSWREGFPRVVLEAGAAGKPVITTSATGCKDSVVEGRTGLVYATGDTEALASTIRTLLDDPEKRLELGRCASAYIRENYAQRLVWDGYDVLFRLMTAGSK